MQSETQSHSITHIVPRNELDYFQPYFKPYLLCSSQMFWISLDITSLFMINDLSFISISLFFYKFLVKVENNNTSKRHLKLRRLVNIHILCYLILLRDVSYGNINRLFFSYGWWASSSHRVQKEITVRTRFISSTNKKRYDGILCNVWRAVYL